MPPRIESLRTPPIAFAHRGARAHVRENTIEAFQLARRLGATGMETDAWWTADGAVVLDHDGKVKRPGRRSRPIATVDRASLPGHIPTLDDYYEQCGVDLELSIDVKDGTAAAGVVQIARRAAEHHGEPVTQRLWLCTPSMDELLAWRQRFPDVRIVHSTRIGRLTDGPERHFANLAAAGVDAVNMHYTDWTGGLTTLAHRFGLHAFGWDAQHRRVLDELLDAGIDGVYSDHVDRMADSFRAVYGDPSMT